MVPFLKDGWYAQGSAQGLRDAVVDGAIDGASLLFRAAVPIAGVSSLAQVVRQLSTVANPAHRPGDCLDTQALRARLNACTAGMPPLQAYVDACLDHVHQGRDLRALYLHLQHITHMMQLLVVAKLSHAFAEPSPTSTELAQPAQPQQIVPLTAPRRRPAPRRPQAGRDQKSRTR